MADKQLRVVFSFTESELKKFEKYLVDSGVAADKLQDQLKDVGKESDKAFSQATSGINQLVTGVKAFLALEVVNMLKNAAIEASKLAAAGEGIRSAFQNLGGSASQLDMLKKSVGGTVSEMRLLKLSVEALQKGVSLNTFGEVLAYLDKQSDATGQSLEGLADIAINAIGKQSTKGLQQLGLSVKGVEENAKKIGFMPALLQEIGAKSKELGEIQSGTADAYDQLAAAQDNLKEAFGRLVNSAPVQTGLAGLAAVLERITKALTPGTGMSSEELVDAIQKSQEKTAQLELQYSKTINPFKMKSIRNQLEAEKEYRMQLIIEGQGLDRQAEITAQLELNAKVKADEAVLAANEAKIKEVEKAKLLKIADIRKELLQTDADIRAANEDNLAIALGTAEQDLAQAFKNRDQRDFAEKTLMGIEPEQVDEIPKSFKKIETTSEKVKLDFESALNATTQMASLFLALGDENGGPTSFIKKLIAIAAPILNLLTGGVAGTALSAFANFFNEGGMVGQPVGPNRDTVLAGLTLGEYVVKRDSTKKSALLLDAINAGEIDDRILLKLQQSPVVVNVDQAKVVEAIQNMPQVDFYKNGSVLYEVRTQRASARTERIRRTTL